MLDVTDSFKLLAHHVEVAYLDTFDRMAETQEKKEI